METAPEVVMAEMWDYISEVVEKPSPLFGGMLLCPFAKKYKKTHIHWIVGHISVEAVATASFGHRLLIAFIDPRKTFDLKEFEAIVAAVQERRMDCFVMSGHPQNPFALQGVRTHSEPYPNILVASKDMIRGMEKKLFKTKYYSGFSDSELQQYFNMESDFVRQAKEGKT